jgi:hypothetical protein
LVASLQLGEQHPKYSKFLILRRRFHEFHGTTGFLQSMTVGGGICSGVSRGQSRHDAGTCERVVWSYGISHCKLFYRSSFPTYVNFSMQRPDTSHYRGPLFSHHILVAESPTGYGRIFQLLWNLLS